MVTSWATNRTLVVSKMPQQGQFITPTVRLLRRLPNGVGGMGQVWVAEHLSLRAHVAVKFMAPRLIEIDEYARRFEREAQALAALQSPYVAKVFDHAMTADGEPYIVMELLRGETLRSRLQRVGPLPIDEVCRMIKHAAKALSEAHRMGLVHRDIKPDNLFVMEIEGESFLKVIDFGIAKDLDADGTTSSGQTHWGVAKYMSPERLGVEPRVIDQRADLWALGVVAYELFTGTVPFGGKTDFLVAKAVEIGDFTPPSARRPELPQLVDVWMKRAFARDINERFDAAMDMSDKLYLAIHGRTRITTTKLDTRVFVDTAPFIESEPLPASQNFRQEIRKSSGAPKPKETDKPSRPSQLKNVGQGLEGRLPLLLDPGFPSVPKDLQYDEDVDGAWVIFAADDSPRSVTFEGARSMLYAGAWSGRVDCFDIVSRNRSLEWSTRLAGRVMCIASLPGFVAVGCSDGRIRLLESVSGKLAEVMNGHEKPVRDLDVNADGTTLVSCSEDNSLCLWRVNTGELAAVLPEKLDWIRSVAMTSRGTLIAAGTADAAVRVWDSHFRPVATLRDVAATGLVRTIAFSPAGDLLAAGFGDGIVRVWETNSWSLVQTLRGGDALDLVHSLIFDKSGSFVIAGLARGGIRVWRVASGVIERDLAGLGRLLYSLAMSDQGQYLASACNEGRVNVYRWPLDVRLREVPGDKRNGRG